MRFLAVLLMVLTPPFGWALLGFLIYRHGLEQAKTADGTREELAAIREELALIREHLAEMVLEVADVRRAAIPGETDRTR